jgi:hypothetical protein
MKDDLSSWLKHSGATMDSFMDVPSGLFDRLRFVADLIQSAGKIPAKPLLIHRDAGKTPRISVIHTGIIVGRVTPADLVIPDVRLSRQHFKITAHEERHLMNDLASRNGTWVNGRRINTIQLRDGDIIEAGGNVFVFLHIGTGPV